MSLRKSDLKKLTDYLWEIPKSFRSDMRVPARIYASERMLEEILHDRSLEQAVNVTTLPGIQEAALVMPDAHEGYGFPIGAVAAMLLPDGVISPGGIGYDINCGVRLLKSQKIFEELREFLPRLARALYEAVPSGVGRGGKLKLNNQELDEVLQKGVKWTLERSFAEAEDLEHTESRGTLENADPAAVSAHAKNRGRDQLGTMGAGNHFVEVGRVEKIFDEEQAKTFGLFLGQITIMVHCGSRGLGHQVATDYIQLMLRNLEKYNIKLPDRELACAPFSSPEGKNYIAAMAASANFAWANRQLITSQIRKAWSRVLGDSGGRLELLYDVAHNIAKIEEYTLTNTDLSQTNTDSPSQSVSSPRKFVLIVHRKGATRAFPSEPVLIPGSMGTASYVLVGTEEALRQSFGSSCHGAGRRMSRHEALRRVHGGKLKDELQDEGIFVETGSVRGLAEEAPRAYKDIDEVVEVVSQAGIAKKVARLKPVAVIKG